MNQKLPAVGTRDARRRSATAYIIGLLLALATVAAFWPVRHYEFVDYDDQEYVTENAQVRAGLTWPGVVWAFGTATIANWHPLTWLSHMLDCQLHGLNAGGHHLTNLLLHVASTLLLFGVLRRMTQAPWRSAVVAALFALHPLHVESVAWVAERKDVLSTFFFMLTLWAYARYVGESKVQSRKSRVFYALSLAVFAFGLMSKPMLVTLPFVLLLLDYWPLKRVARGAGLWTPDSGLIRRLLWEKLPFFVLSAVVSAIAFRAQQQAGSVASAYGFPFGNRIGNALVSGFRYLRKTFWPDDLAVFYPHPGTWPAWQVLGAGVLLMAVSILVVREARRRPYLLIGWLWFLGTLVPVIGLVQVGMQSMADRYTYVPLIGIFIMLVWLAADVMASTPRRAVVLWPMAVVVLTACFVTTRWQLRHWQNTETLFLRALRVTQNNDVAHNGLGVICHRQGKTGEAIAHFEAAIRFRPGNALAQNNLGAVLLAQGKMDEAIAHLNRALEINPDYASAHDNLGLAYERLGQKAEAEKHFATSLRLRPDQPDAHNHRGSTAFQEGRFSDALTCFQAALQTNPDSVETHQNLGMTLAALGRTSEAIAEYEAALRLKPELPVVHNKLGSLLLGQGKIDEASSHFSAALRVKPDFAAAHSNLGLILARQNKLDAAITHYRDALRSESNHVVAHYNLALALARQNQWDEALEHFSAVVRLKPDHGEAHNQLGFALARQEKLADAAAHFELALQHGAESAEAHANLAKASGALGRIEVAVQHFREAVRLRPDGIEALNDLAWLLATCAEAKYRNGAEAVRLAERAVALTQSKDAGKLDTLAAAYAEAGRFGEAIKTAQQAMTAATAAGQRELRAQVETRLRIFEQSRPFREPARDAPPITR